MTNQYHEVITSLLGTSVQIRSSNGRVQILRYQTEPTTQKRKQVLIVSWSEVITPSIDDFVSVLSESELAQLRDFLDIRAKEKKQKKSEVALISIVTSLSKFQELIPKLAELTANDTGPIFRNLKALRQAVHASQSVEPDSN